MRSYSNDLLPTRGRRLAASDLDAATGTFAVYHPDIKTFELTGTRSTYSWLDDVLIDVPRGRASRNSILYAQRARWSRSCQLLALISGVDEPRYDLGLSAEEWNAPE